MYLCLSTDIVFGVNNVGTIVDAFFFSSGRSLVWMDMHVTLRHDED